MAYDPNDADTKAAIQTAVDEATALLIAKRDELLSEKKALQKRLNSGAADPAAVERLEAALETANAALETANGDLKKATKERDKLKTDFEAESASGRKLLIDGGLTGALASANVAKQFLPAVQAMFAGKVDVKAEGGERKLFIGDKPLAEAITAWSQSDEGKHYVAAGGNGGGGALGGAGGNADTKSVARAAFDAMPHSERTVFLTAGGKITD